MYTLELHFRDHSKKFQSSNTGMACQAHVSAMRAKTIYQRWKMAHTVLTRFYLEACRLVVDERWCHIALGIEIKRDES